jgi:hypothetical protein
MENIRKCILKNIRNSFYERIVSEFADITDDMILIIKCNDLNERSAVSRLAMKKGYRAVAMVYNGWRENFILESGNEDKHIYFSKLDWNCVNGNFGDYDYNGGIIYYHDEERRFRNYMSTPEIIDLDYNAVAIYPNHMKYEYSHVKDFYITKTLINKRKIRKEETILIHTDVQEENIINNIYKYDSKLLNRCGLLRGCDVRKVLLLWEIADKNLIVLDISKIILSWYYIINNI